MVLSDDEVHAQMDINVYGPYRLIRASLPGFRKRKTGTIINVSSVSGPDGAIGSGLYAASKFALEGRPRFVSVASHPKHDDTLT